VEPFINWIRGVEIYFETKGVSHDDDKLQLVGNFLRETNTTTFDRQSANRGPNLNQSSSRLPFPQLGALTYERTSRISE
jgi:hypothetical protein